MPNIADNKKVNAITLDSGVSGPHVLIIAGIHGDEFEPMLAANELLNLLPSELTRGSVTIIPVANEPAYGLGSRYGEEGLDLARTFPGDEAGSTTQIIAHQITGLIRNADYMIDLHTGGTLFDITPLSGYLLHPDKTVLEKQQLMAEAFNLPLIWGTNPNAEGRTLSAARDFNIPAIYAESGGGTGISNRTIERYVEGCINVLSRLEMIDCSIKNKISSFYWLEDHRPGQGHLQSKLPAPIDGIFHPVVSLGEFVQKGTLLGLIIDLTGRKELEVFAGEEGMVFMIRVSSRVKEGDTLGGILPITKREKKVIYAE